MKGLGPGSEQALAAIGIHDGGQLIDSDPVDVYRRLLADHPDTSLVFLYALIGAIEGLHWQQVARERKTEILLRLDDLGIAPK